MMSLLMILEKKGNRFRLNWKSCAFKNLQIEGRGETNYIMQCETSNDCNAINDSRRRAQMPKTNPKTER